VLDRLLMEPSLEIVGIRGTTLAAKLAINLRWDEGRALWLARSRWCYASTGPNTGSLDIITEEARRAPKLRQGRTVMTKLLTPKSGVLERKLPSNDRNPESDAMEPFAARR
jgi:hypothetical protein